MGIQLSQNVSIIADIFDVKIKDPIVFQSGIVGGYFNDAQTGTSGIELSSKILLENGYFDLTYSYYKDTHNRVDIYNVPSSDSLLSFPQHKFTLNSSYQLSENINVSPSTIYLGSRRANIITMVEGSRSSNIERLDSSYLINLSLSFDQFSDVGIRLRFSIFNLFDEEYDFIQSSVGLHNPLPGSDREILFRARLEY